MPLLFVISYGSFFFQAYQRLQIQQQMMQAQRNVSGPIRQQEQQVSQQVCKHGNRLLLVDHQLTTLSHYVKRVCSPFLRMFLFCQSDERHVERIAYHTVFFHLLYWLPFCFVQNLIILFFSNISGSFLLPLSLLYIFIIVSSILLLPLNYSNHLFVYLPNCFSQ